MQRLIVTFIIALLVQAANGQNRPQFSLYNLNNYLINPAITGAEQYGDLRLGYRNQWQGLSGAPVTYYLSYHTPIGAQFLKSKDLQRGYQLDPYNKPANDRPSRTAHHGLGGLVLIDEIGPFNHTQISVSYAYHLTLSSDLALSAGASVGYAQNSIDYSEVVFENDQDNVLGEGVVRDKGVDGAIGMWLYSQKFYLGISGLKKFSKGFEVNDTEFSSDEQWYWTLSGGYKFNLSRDVSLMPNVMLRYPQGAPLSYDAGIILSYKDRLWAGGSYRNHKSIIVLARFGISELLDLGYSYDFSTTKLSVLGTGSHEIVLGLKLKNRNRVHSRSSFF